MIPVRATACLTSITGETPTRYLTRCRLVKAAGYLRTSDAKTMEYPKTDQGRRGILFFNPASAGKRRFRTVQSVGILNIGGEEIEPTVIRL